MEYDIENCRNLMEAVSLLAVNDYCNARVKLENSPNSNKPKYIMEECLDFFRSKLFKSFYTINVEKFLEKLELYYTNKFKPNLSLKNK